jgi:hypothetical protein
MLSLLNFLVSLAFLPQNLFILIISIKKIRKAKIILIQDDRNGFGNIYSSIDLCRHLFNEKEILIISFFEENRFHNKYIFRIFRCDYIIFKTSIFIKFLNKCFGEFNQKSNYFINKEQDLSDNFFLKENSYFTNKKIYFYKLLTRKLLIKVIMILSNLKSKFYTINSLYNYAANKYNKVNLLPKDLAYLKIYFKLINLKNRPSFKNSLRKKIIRKINFNFDKSVCLYIRDKNPDKNNNYTPNLKVYINIINYLKKKNYYIYLIGDTENIEKILNKEDKFKKNIITFRTALLNKDLFTLFVQTECKFFIGTNGGGALFSLYFIKSLIFDMFPLGLKFPRTIQIYQSAYKNDLLLRKNSFDYKEIKFKNLIFIKSKKIILKKNSYFEIKKYLSKYFK